MLFHNNVILPRSPVVPLLLLELASNTWLYGGTTLEVGFEEETRLLVLGALSDSRPIGGLPSTTCIELDRAMDEFDGCVPPGSRRG